MSPVRRPRCRESRGTPWQWADALWCQSGVINFDGAEIASAGGVTVIMDRCLKVKHPCYVSRMHWVGSNTQRITSIRTGLQ